MRYYAWTTHDTDSWRDLANSILPMEHRFRQEGDWRADLTAQDTPTYRVLRWVQHGDRIAVRTPSAIRRVPGDEHYWIVVPRAGAYTVRHGEEETRALPGQASVMGMDEACLLTIPQSEAYAMQVPRAELDGRLGSSGSLRLLLDLDSGLGRIVDTMLRSVHEEREHLADHEFHAVCDRITELFCMIVRSDGQPPENHLTEVAQVVRRYVRERLGAGKLPLTAVAHGLGWSPRQLRHALQETGTTYRDLRREETLRAARDLLQDPARADLTIGDIAARAGLTATWFSSAFKDRYGEAPREFRRRALDGCREQAPGSDHSG
jgi:AraC-like DNA-binding protein